MSDPNPLYIKPGQGADPWFEKGYMPEELSNPENDPMLKPEVLEEFKKLLGWFYYERDRQAVNRMEMAMDNLFYDNEQWDANDAAILRSRGQMPLVYNEVAVMVDWLIGTERRTKIDWSVLPRTEDDVDIADIKTKLMKYISDVNKSQMVRSRAFADAVKVGVGWVDDGARDDPTEETIYNKYEDWRNVLWDSNSYDLDLAADCRYIFRWKWIDEDIACAMFPGQEHKIHKAARDQQFGVVQNDDLWYLGENVMDTATGTQGTGMMGSFGQAGIMTDNKRQRVKLIECQYKKPVKSMIVGSGPMKGSFINQHDVQMQDRVRGAGDEIIEKIALRVHHAVFTESDVLAIGESIYRHNRFSLTPIWCYRRGRDRLPYGAIRRVRDIQMDLNKRASKALFMLNTNQIIYDEGAIDDLELTRDEADRPDGMIAKKKGYDLEIRRDTDAATGQLNMMTLAAQTIQKVTGVNDENLGRATNAVSGKAIEARQNTGSVSTTEPFDNLRFAASVSGQKQLSLSEQFYTDEKVIRISGAQNKIEWFRINQPEQQPDGSVKFLNDITASQADFIVVDADYAGTLRQVMFDSLQGLVQKLPPEVGLRLFTLAMEFSDLPNHNEIADAIRAMTGDQDPNKKPTPEQMQQQEIQKQQQAEAMQMQRESAMLALEEQKAKIQDIQASAQQKLANSGGDGDQAIMEVQRQAAEQIDALTQQLNKLQMEMASRTLQIQSDADTKLEIARIDSDTKLRIAEIQAGSNETLAAIDAELQSVMKPDKEQK